MIIVKDLHKEFEGNNHVLRGVNYHIHPGEKIVVVGPSGSGKSTFLRCLNLLEQPTSGEIWFDGQKITDYKTDINKVRRHMGMVFQHFNLFHNLTIMENITLAPVKLKLMSEEEAARLSTHFRSKVEEARRHTKDNAGMVSFYQVMKDTLDYRKWFEFQLFSQKKGERMKELTNSVFGTFSGGEKAMSMYVPLFSAVVAKYQGGVVQSCTPLLKDFGFDYRNRYCSICHYGDIDDP